MVAVDPAEAPLGAALAAVDRLIVAFSGGVDSSYLLAAACLASRVVYGLPVTPARLSRIERAEAWLRARLPDRTNIRVRDHGGRASIEVDADQIPTVAGFFAEATHELHELGWTSVTLDHEGFRSGKLNRVH